MSKTIIICEPDEVPVRLPFEDLVGNLVLDPGSRGMTLPRGLNWLDENVSSPEECERIFRGAVCLMAHLNGEATFGECLDTAIIWERG